MLLPFIAMLILISTGIIALAFFSRLRRLGVVAQGSSPIPGFVPERDGTANRYRPMIRLLADEDTAFLSGDKALARSLRAQRREIFRGYLNCLTKDYARLLNGVRLAMVRSGVDRPDLARALAKNRVLFTLALCRIEYRLLLHQAGMGKVDVSGLVDAIDALRAQAGFLLTPPAQFVMAR
jgi:hypothetical protein